MRVLEKILQEIEEHEDNYNKLGTLKLCPLWVKEIIKRNLQSGEDNKVLADDWVPCSVRMPENANKNGAFCPKYQIMTAYGVTEGWYNPDTDGWYVVFWFITDRLTENEISFLIGDIPKLIFIPNKINKIILAWRPLPEPYKPDTESADGKRQREREEFFNEYKDGE